MQLNSLPKLDLARLPTPIDVLKDLSELLGVHISVKRDDLTGSELSGNKVRKLEYVLAEALDQDADVVITCGGAQSNHCRATALACRRLGLEPELFLRGATGADARTGNLFLSQLCGARVHPISAEEYRVRDQLMAARAEELAAEGRNAYVIPEGASNALGSLGYVQAMAEIRDAERGADAKFDTVVVAVGSGGTLAGLIAGAEVHGFEGRILGVPVCDDALTFQARCQLILDDLRNTYLGGLGAQASLDHFLPGFVGGGYGIATTEDLERLKDVAILTGLILDPVYTNKAFEGLLTAIRDGRIEQGSRVLFIHTGGIYGLFPYAREMPLA
ncbi:MAG TPA: D-cysteine desulfhydrase family protein [Planctomycetota bacterium]|jgi:D-cysteine desulfhydrase|nr:D-cysteine desulfhydrase family protein [Planctomycetota bacterium]